MKKRLFSKDLITIICVTIIALMQIMLINDVSALNDDTIQSVTLNVNEIAEVNAYGGTVNLAATAPLIPGGNFIPGDDNSTKLEYTSVLSSNFTRNITVKWGIADMAPTGTHLEVKITGTPNSGQGTFIANPVTLNSNPQNIVVGIQSCNTGGSGASPAVINYKLAIDDLSQLRADDDKSATITFTISDAS